MSRRRKKKVPVPPDKQSQQNFPWSIIKWIGGVIPTSILYLFFYEKHCGIPRSNAVLCLLIVGGLGLGVWYFFSKYIQKHKTLLLIGSLVLLLTSVIGFSWRKYSLPKAEEKRVLLAPFRDGSDPFNVTNILFKGLTEKQNSALSPFQLSNGFSEAKGAALSKECLSECEGTAIVWGSYSEAAEGMAIVHVDFAKECARKWAGTDLLLREIPVTESFQLDLQKHMNVLVSYVLSFSEVIADTSSCQFKALPAKSERLMSGFIAETKGVVGLEQIRKTALIFLSNHFYNLKDYVSAISWLREGHRSFPQDIDFLDLLALSSRQSGDRLEALAWVEKSIQVDPHNPSLWNNKGILLREVGRIDDAEVSYSRAIADAGPASKENQPVFLTNRGSLYELKGAYIKAIDDYTAAIAYKESPVVIESRAHAALAAGKLELAQSDMRRLSKLLVEGSPKVLALDAALNLERGNFEIAETQFTKLIAHLEADKPNIPKLSSAYYNRALAKVRNNHVGPGTKDVLKALEYYPREPNANFLLCQIYEKSGEYQGALSACKIAKEMMFSSAEIDLIIKRLEKNLKNKFLK